MSSRPQSRQADTAEPSVIYDFGMNNGDDVAYYLLKGHRVVGVEANSDLCAEVEERFAREIETGRLRYSTSRLPKMNPQSRSTSTSTGTTTSSASSQSRRQTSWTSSA